MASPLCAAGWAFKGSRMDQAKAELVIKAIRTIMRSAVSVYDQVDDALEDGDFGWGDRAGMMMTGLRVATSLEALYRELDAADIDDDEVFAGMALVDQRLGAPTAVQDFGFPAL